MHKPMYLLLFIPLFLATGCATFNGARTREADKDAFLAGLEERTAQELEKDTPLDLERCIAIALDNNLAVKSADLDARLAKLKRDIAFSNFLPTVTFEYTSTELNRAPASSIIAGMSTTMQDRIIRETTVQAQMPIFAPATWFLYAAHKRGEEIGALAADYTRQMIALQVTGLYYQCLATQETRCTLESQRAAAETLVKEVEAYHREGMVTDADLAQVRLLLLARETALESNARAKERNLAELLTAMGVSPTAEPALEASHPLTAPEGELADWILEALLNNPRLAIADRQVAIEREKVRIAIADFLPMLAGFAARSHTSNSFMTYPYASALGFTGLMTLFNGFKNINEYKAARVEQEQAFLAREQESLAVMLEAVKAHSTLEEARSTLRLADAAVDAEAKMLAERAAKMREGLLRPSEMLDTVAKHDAAQVNAANARYQEQVMTAIALNVLGATWTEKKDEDHE